VTERVRQDTEGREGRIRAVDIARAWEREVPGIPVRSIPVITTLWRTGKVFSDDRQRTLRRLGLDAATLDLLSTLRRAGSPYRLTTRELAARTLVSAGAISQRVARAEKDGLVLRKPSVEGRRAVTVELTEAGHDLLIPAVRQLLEHEESLVAPLSDAEQAQLVLLLEKLQGGLLAVDGDGPFAEGR
jgi:DNA-binding MarR family transcriptional regulator